MEESQKQPLLTIVKRYLQNNKIIVIVWIITVFLSSLITIVQGTGILVNFYKNRIGEENEMYEKINKFRANVNINYFEELMGKPMIINSSKDFATKEEIFVNKYFYLQTITNKDGNVLSFGVTTRRKNFIPELNLIPQLVNNDDKQRKTKLNSTTFYDFSSDRADWCYLYIGARRFSYFEEYYLANPGNYQTVLIGINDAGYLGKEWSSEGLDSSATEKIGTCSGISEGFRKKSFINTFIITAPFVEGKDFGDFGFGVDYDQVRVLD